MIITVNANAAAIVAVPAAQANSLENLAPPAKNQTRHFDRFVGKPGEALFENFNSACGLLPQSGRCSFGFGARERQRLESRVAVRIRQSGMHFRGAAPE